MRLAEGLMSAEEFIAFLGGAQSDPFAGLAIGAVVVAAFLGGLAMNLTPCVLPMVPVNLIVIGKSAKRGFAYGLGIALAYGVLGVAAAVGGMAFGTIQSNPWFNAAVALVFVGLALALGGVFTIDFSRFRRTGVAANGGASLLFPFAMGCLGAVLAGACVAPILIAVLVLTSDLFAKGHPLALGLPFVLGLGMSLPWPFLGAGLRFLPRPGAWMKGVNRIFAAVVLGFAVWYGILAWRGFSPAAAEAAGTAVAATPETFAARLAEAKRPVLVDCWATWCKNCAAMDRVIAAEPVKSHLKGWTVIRLQAEKMRELRKLEGFGKVKGLPAFAVFEADDGK